jgi:DNA-binding MarR family transcriptional regulator
VDLTPAERTLLLHMVTSGPLIDAETAAEECGIALTSAKVALNRFCELGLATRVRSVGDRRSRRPVYELTPDGRQVGFELAG